jgi:tRNA-Thr(GGU) m(6)t(6)A37 methyltransferase TsaA
MDNRLQGQNKTYQIYPIGSIRRTEHEIHLEILKPYRPGLQQLNQFSHVMVFWWADQHDNDQSRNMLQTEPPYAPGKVTGVFACRAEYRPNPIAMTVCKLGTVDEAQGIVQVQNIDAYDGTRIIDLKAYFPVCDRVKHASIPTWLSGWPEWMPEEGIGLWE